MAAEKEQQLKELETLYENLRITTANLSPAEISRKMFFLRKDCEEKNKTIKVILRNRSGKTFYRAVIKEIISGKFLEYYGENY